MGAAETRMHLLEKHPSPALIDLRKTIDSILYALRSLQESSLLYPVFISLDLEQITLQYCYGHNTTRPVMDNSLSGQQLAGLLYQCVS